jgi:NAD(P)-dependent dehydrogenase (short-subunit alcohol dehydrogenase family)
LPIRLDVTDRNADFAAVKLAHDYFGRLDVIVNNARYGRFGMGEEISGSEAWAQLETNLLGALWVTQAALPYLREQGRGHIVLVSSIGGISTFANTGADHAAKWALAGLSQSLAQEVAGFGIKGHADRAGWLLDGLGGRQLLQAVPRDLAGCAQR